MVVSTLYLCGGPLLCIIDTCYQERAFPTRLRTQAPLIGSHSNVRRGACVEPTTR